MPRALWLVLAAGIAVWAAALLQVEHRAPPPAAEADPDLEPTAVPLARPEPVRSTSSAPPPSEPVGPPAPGAQPRNFAANPRGVVATAAATWRAARDAFVKGGKTLPTPQPVVPPDQVATGELGDAPVSPEDQALERAYTHEPRDGAWAADQERILRFALRSTPVTQNLSLVNCQQSICRLVLEGADPDAFKKLMEVPELAQITGLTPTSPYSYRSGQLSVYFPRRSAIVGSVP